MLKAGDTAPDFELPSDTGETISLSSLRGRPVVIYFYPADDTPGCTTQACDFRDNWRAVEDTGAVVLGISPDSVESHRRFKEKYQLPHVLLADEDHRVAEAYGAWGEKKLYGKVSMGLIRSTFIVDPDGSVARAMPRVRTKGHAGRVLDALAEMNS